jgi:hypothetical protein
VIGGGGGRASTGSDCPMNPANETPTKRVPALIGSLTSSVGRSPSAKVATRFRSIRTSS